MVTVTPEEQLVRCREALAAWHAGVESMGLEVMALSTGELGTRDEWAERGRELEDVVMGALVEWLNLHVGAATASALQAAPEEAGVVVEEVWGIVLRAVPAAAVTWAVQARHFRVRPDAGDLVGMELWLRGLDPRAPELAALSAEDRRALHVRFLEMHDAHVAASQSEGGFGDGPLLDWDQLVAVDSELVSVMIELGELGG